MKKTLSFGVVALICLTITVNEPTNRELALQWQRQVLTVSLSAFSTHLRLSPNPEAIDGTYRSSYKIQALESYAGNKEATPAASPQTPTYDGECESLLVPTPEDESFNLSLHE